MKINPVQNIFILWQSTNKFNVSFILNKIRCQKVKTSFISFSICLIQGLKQKNIVLLGYIKWVEKNCLLVYLFQFKLQFLKYFDLNKWDKIIYLFYLFTRNKIKTFSFMESFRVVKWKQMGKYTERLFRCRVGYLLG